MNHFGKDSPDEILRIPSICVVPQTNGVTLHFGHLEGVRSTVNESVRTTVGSTTAYRAGWERAFGTPEQKPCAN